ncbi:cellulose synthase (UDP-forming) [Roseinatronobacter thiooxidans]|uniref:Cellulose synthase (UDP-forming) n=2 Tax=Roseinatronobacter thiooxidans TaxID=121821 RepID=A0A2W7QPU2_9RHOB|nr:cellulose synthase (UDP-forming) [Roseinatronobacter thiooxidans]
MQATRDMSHASASEPPSYLVPLLSRAQSVKYHIAFALWLAAAAYFWVWWFTPSHNINMLSFVVLSVAIGWLFFVQLYFLSMFLHARVSSARIADLGTPRVAMITTKTPSEPFAVLRITLEAMLAQDYPHDTWLADEDPTPETLEWCAAHGVKISSRKGVAEYHQPDWPRRTKCKEGNLAYFYDHYGYQNYDFVAQLDSDHVAQPGYLTNLLAPFADARVGYVSAPSICGSNASENWAARTRLSAEGMFHGILQSGYTNGLAPVCIGSHYAVRTAALQQIGGLGPELAEDHSTTMIFNANGWRGVHAIDAIAIGAGPVAVTDLVTQEFQWSRSLMTVLLVYTPRYIARLPPRMRAQFIFMQMWYPLQAMFMALMFTLPILALMFDFRFVDVKFPIFVAHILPSTLVIVWIAFAIRRDGFFRPKTSAILSWEKALFISIQWPWVLWGTGTAIFDYLTGTRANFRVTPKGAQETRVLPFRVLAPYFALALASGLPILLAGELQHARGFYILAAINLAIYTTICAVMVIWHIRENKISLRRNMGPAAVQFTGITVLAALIVSSLSLRGVESLHVLSMGLEPLHLTRVLYPVSGAGLHSDGAGRIRLEVWWE